MALDYARDLAVSVANRTAHTSHSIRTVMSVPASLDFFDRLVLSKAAEMADLSITEWTTGSDSTTWLSALSERLNSNRNLGVTILEKTRRDTKDFV
jgi:hypothetical protein